MRKYAVLGMLLLSLAAAALIASCSSKSTDSPNNGGSNNGGKELNSAQLGQNQTYSHTFATAGVYHYHCSIHTSMKGTITVVAGGAPTQANVTIQNFSFVDPAVTVNVGSTVTWMNMDGVNHTVTSD